MNHIARILKSYFSLPVWVIIWIGLFLVPANFSGYWFMDTASGWWIAVLGATGIIVNLPIVWLNGGLSKVLCIPHILFWTPLVVILGYRLLAVPMNATEFTLALAVFAVNGMSLAFDYYDFFEWRRGNRAVAGYPDDPVRF
ncbi:hypothetical protein [Oricola sp.]|uniref:hypothetical protein n=1 Tax=Oricola sp. TaxID=1979950 RepID=UPI003BA96EB7